MDRIGPTFITIITGIIGLAIIAVLVSTRAQTPNVITASGAALANIINAAVQPVTSGGGFGVGNTAQSLLSNIGPI
jgi:hypothetical protein